MKDESQTPQTGNPQFVEMEPAELVDFLVKRAEEQEASDIFLMTGERACEFSIRRMGMLESVVHVPRPLGIQVINMIKSSAGLDLAERHRPVDGRWSYSWGDQRVDFRVNAMGTLFGEDLALRVLRSAEQMVDFDSLGFVADQLAHVKAMLSRPGGLILVTGPTGSGKTTTLYALVKHLNTGRAKINTLEDPIEHAVDGIRQSQVMPRIGLDFSELLRGAIRQGPDVIMVGEIRDRETAETAVRAANSGHLVLSTLHSPMATDVIQSMLAYGVHPVFLANALLGVVAQRLVRALDPESRVRYDLVEGMPTFEDIKSYLSDDEGKAIYGPPIGEEKLHAGYAGLTGLFEVLTISKALRGYVMQGVSGVELRQHAVEAGMLDFRRAAMIKVAKGVTSLEEVARTIPEIDDEEVGEQGSFLMQPFPLSSPSIGSNAGLELSGFHENSSTGTQENRTSGEPDSSGRSRPRISGR